MKAHVSHAAVVGAYLAAARKKRCLSQGYVAGQMGLSQPSWSRIEAGSPGTTVSQLVQWMEVVYGCVDWHTFGAAVADSIDRLRKEGVVVGSGEESFSRPVPVILDLVW